MPTSRAKSVGLRFAVYAAFDKCKICSDIIFIEYFNSVADPGRRTLIIEGSQKFSICVFSYHHQ